MRYARDWLRAYVEYTRNLEAPDKFHFWSAVATVAGALRGKVWIDMGYWKWKPNFFIIFVAPPGIVAKSTTIGNGIELLREVDGIHFGPDSCTWQGITDSFRDSSVGHPMPDGGILQMSAITIAASELGTFLDPKNREMIDLLVDLWDGRQVPWKRRTHGEGESEVVNPWLNFIGCTTPSWVSENFPEYAIGGGFVSRTIFIYGEHKRHLMAYPARAPDAKEVKELKASLILDLREIALLAGEFQLTEDAFLWGTRWYENHWTNIPEHLRNERMGGYLARKQTHMHKLAMIISASQRSDLTINSRDLARAEDLITSLEQDMPSVFSKVSDNKEAKQSAALLLIVKNEKKITRQDLWRRVFHLMSSQDFDLAMQGIVNAGYVKCYGAANANADAITIISQIPDTLAQSRETSSESSIPKVVP